MKDIKCPFCFVDSKLLIDETPHCFIVINLMQVARTDALLVVPKRHVKNIIELSTIEYEDFFTTIRYVYSCLSEAGRNKFNILINEGLVAGQTVPHLHAHIFSRKEKDGIKNLLRNNRKNIFTDRTPEKTDKFLQKINTYFSNK